MKKKNTEMEKLLGNIKYLYTVKKSEKIMPKLYFDNKIR